MVAFALGVPWSFVVLPLTDTGNAALFALAMAGTYAIAGSAYGPMAAFIPQSSARGTATAERACPSTSRDWWAAQCRRSSPHPAGRLGSTRHRPDDGGRRAGQPGMHRPAARDQRRCTAKPVNVSLYNVKKDNKGENHEIQQVEALRQHRRGRHRSRGHPERWWTGARCRRTRRNCNDCAGPPGARGRCAGPRHSSSPRPRPTSGRALPLGRSSTGRPPRRAPASIPPPTSATRASRGLFTPRARKR